MTSRRAEALLAQRDDAPAETAPGQAGPVDAGGADERIDQLVDDGERDAVVLGQAAVAIGHHGADPGQVAPGQEPLDLAHPGALGDDVARPPAQDRLGQRAQVAQVAAA